MTEQDLGLRFIVEPSSTRLTSEEREQLRIVRPAGVMFRKRNFLQDAPYPEWLSSYAELLADVRAAIGRPNIIVSVDHEGGRVHRFPPPITRFPYPAYYSASDEAIREVATAMAIELKTLGVNLSCSPVADIHSNPDNPVINQRAFGRTAVEVTHRAQLCASHLLQHGIFPCAKHFPGHGDTSADSHFAVPVVDRSLDQLLEAELAPFAALIKLGIPAIMSAHIMLPQLDANSTATLSKPIMVDLLRTKLGFTGVTIADALGMMAIKGEVDGGSFAERATNAELDLLLYVGDPVSIGDALRCKEELTTLMNSSQEHRDKEIRCERRIASLLEKLPCYEVSALEDATLNRHQALCAALPQQAEWSDFVLDIPGYD